MLTVNVISSNIQSLGYSLGALFVKFNNGSTYKYKGVPFSVYRELESAESVGKTLNAKVKGVYEYERLQ